MKLGLKVLLAILILGLSLIELKATEKRFSLAVLPFKNNSGDNFNWLSGAMSDALLGKVQFSENILVLEREYLERVLEFGKWEITPDSDLLGLFGADAILTGSVTILGENIRIYCRIIQANSAKISPKSVMVVDGPLKDLFKLQFHLAKQINKRLGSDLSLDQLSYQEAKNNDSHRFLQLGKMSFQENDWQKALQFFIKAQEFNEVFFPKAHYYEGCCRTKLAEIEPDEKEKKRLQQEHIKKFERDASEAAAAFFNLGMAYQANQLYEKALDAYSKYLRWLSENNKAIRWKHQQNKGLLHMFNPSSNQSPREVDPIEANFGEIPESEYCLAWQSGNLIFSWEGDRLVCQEVSTGKKLWDSPQKSKATRTFRHAIAFGKRVVLISSENGIQWLNLQDGKVVKSWNPNFPKGGSEGVEEIQLSQDEKYALLLRSAYDDQKKILKNPYVLNLYHWNLMDDKVHFLKKIESGNGRYNFFRKDDICLIEDPVIRVIKGNVERSFYEIDLVTASYKKSDAQWLKQNHELIEKCGYNRTFSNFLQVGSIFTSKVWKEGMPSYRLGVFSLTGKRLILELPETSYFRGINKETLYFENEGGVEGYSQSGELIFRYEYPKDDRYRFAGLHPMGFLIKGSSFFLCLNEKNLSVPSLEAKANLNKALCLRKLERYEEAVESLERTIVISPNLAEAYYHMAELKNAILEEEKDEKRQAINSKSQQLKFEALKFFSQYLSFPVIYPKKAFQAREYLRIHGGVEKRISVSKSQLFSDGKIFFEQASNSFSNDDGKKLRSNDYRVLGACVSDNLLIQLEWVTYKVYVVDWLTGKSLHEFNLEGRPLKRIQGVLANTESGFFSFGYGDRTPLIVDEGYLFSYNYGSDEMLITGKRINDPKDMWTVSIGKDLKEAIPQGEVKDGFLLIHVRQREKNKSDQLALINLKKKELTWKRNLSAPFGSDDVFVLDQGHIFYCAASRKVLVMDFFSGKTIVEFPFELDQAHPVFLPNISLVQFREKKNGRDFYKAFDTKTLVPREPIDIPSFHHPNLLSSSKDKLVIQNHQELYEWSSLEKNYVRMRTFRNYRPPRNVVKCVIIDNRVFMVHYGLQTSSLYKMIGSEIPDVWFESEKIIDL